MASIGLDLQHCLVLAVDLQENLLGSIEDADRVLKRCEYLLSVASLVEIPSVVTTQNAMRLGPTSCKLERYASRTHDKQTFSCWKDASIREHIGELGRRKVILCGVETHICVSFTALDLLEAGYEVAVCPDAVGASNTERHKLGMERMRDAGIVPVHSEAVAYEWLQSAHHPQFRNVLAETKRLR